MKFDLPGSVETFELPDDWWFFAEMDSFRHGPGGYYPYKPGPENDVQVVPIGDIEPPRRNPGVPMLRKVKMLPVLFAFQSPECALPPVEVYLSTSGRYRFTVHNGFHRFYGAVAAGYTLLPILVREPFDP